LGVGLAVWGKVWLHREEASEGKGVPATAEVVGRDSPSTRCGRTWRSGAPVMLLGWSRRWGLVEARAWKRSCCSGDESIVVAVALGSGRRAAGECSVKRGEGWRKKEEDRRREEEKIMKKK